MNATTINLQAKPQVSISNPADGDAFSPSANVTLNARATDYDGQITNFTLLVNGLELTHTNSTKIVASWTTNTPGFYTNELDTPTNTRSVPTKNDLALE